MRRKPTFRWLPDLAVLLPLGGGLIFGGRGYGVGTPIDFNRACARLARAFIPSRYVLTSFPGRFSTLHPSCQYSSICASVSADPRASLPRALHAAPIRPTAALKVGCSRSR